MEYEVNDIGVVPVVEKEVPVPKLDKEEGRTTEVDFGQPKNGPLPNVVLVTLFGIQTEVSVLEG